MITQADILTAEDRRRLEQQGVVFGERREGRMVVDLNSHRIPPEDRMVARRAAAAIYSVLPHGTGAPFLRTVGLDLDLIRRHVKKK